uniref:hypothetical protein n=1 Tax=Lacticaseibacillus zeae TaxID=57037 RepID=UPI001ED998A0|nr:MULTISPECIES: hypothetical protein [Lacticaseibacillus]
MSDVKIGILVRVQMNDSSFKLRVAFVCRLATGVAMDKAVFALLFVALAQSVKDLF